MEDYTITTIYYDGQFWSALIEKRIGDVSYSGRYVFGAEPSNPELLQWMNYQFDKVRMYPVEQVVKIRIKKEVEKNHSIKKSLDAFKESQKEFLEQKKQNLKNEKRKSKQEKYFLEQQKKKAKKNH